MQVLIGADLKNMLLAAAQNLSNQKERVNALNVFPVPDGDTGTNMSLTLQAAVQELNTLSDNTVGGISASVARGSLMGARGNSGVILSQFFRGFGEGLKDVSEATSNDLARAFEIASETTYKAVMKPVEGTMLTVGKAMAQGAKRGAKQGANVQETLEAALKEGRTALANTPNIMTVLKQAGVVDAGGDGLVCILEGMLQGLTGEAIIVSRDPVDVPAYSHPSHDEGITRIEGQLVNRYCTEFLIRGENLSVDQIRETLEPKGESMLVVGDAGVIKVHIHTDHPGEVLEYCGGFGDLVDIKIDNMKIQNEKITEDHHRASTDNVVEFPHAQAQAGERKAIGLVAVVPGPGLAEIFKSLGVDEIVTGGQTMNPSTEDLVNAVKGVNADQVIILPNNKNVVFSAQQVKELVDIEVGVIPTRSVPQGIGALMSFDADLSLTENTEQMEESMKQVKTGEVTYAVRATKAGDIEIAERDIIGLAEGKIAVAGQGVNDVTMQLLEKMVDDESSVISVYCGDNQELSEAESLAEQVREAFPECEVELYDGGQPLYYYILSVE